MKVPYRTIPLVNNNFYHVFNRGVEKRRIFTNPKDFNRFVEAMFYYQFSNPKPSFSLYRRFRNQSFDQNPKIVDVICYCLMPNHFHLLLRQLVENGISEFIGKLTNGYSKYFNIKNNRVGSLFQGQFKVAMIETDEQLIHVSRYIHLNPFVAELTQSIEEYRYSSWGEYINKTTKYLCDTKTVINLFSSPEHYKQFVFDQSDYGLTLEKIKHLLHE